MKVYFKLRLFVPENDDFYRFFRNLNVEQNSEHFFVKSDRSDNNDGRRILHERFCIFGDKHLKK